MGVWFLWGNCTSLLLATINIYQFHSLILGNNFICLIKFLRVTIFSLFLYIRNSEMGYKPPALELLGILIKILIPWILQTVWGECFCRGHGRGVQATLLGMEETESLKSLWSSAARLLVYLQLLNREEAVENSHWSSYDMLFYRLQIFFEL